MAGTGGQDIILRGIEVAAIAIPNLLANGWVRHGTAGKCCKQIASIVTLQKG